MKIVAHNNSTPRNGSQRVLLENAKASSKLRQNRIFWKRAKVRIITFVFAMLLVYYTELSLLLLVALLAKGEREQQH